jgi:RNA polymerase sigma-70 factor (ECF subfamily)
LETQHHPGDSGGPSDLELVEAVRQGDRRAYGTLVDRHLKSVYSVALRILGHATDAEDISQDTFLRAFERIDLFDPQWSFRNWLLKIASNLAINRIRSRGREKRLQSKLAEAIEPMIAGPVEPDELPSPREWAYWLDQIDESQRAAIVLFHFHDMPYTEIAEVLQVPVNTVRTYLYRGRKRLRELMSGREVSENGSWTVAK